MATPSAAQFLIFVRNVMGITAGYLPDNSPFLTYAFQSALAIANDDLGSVPAPLPSAMTWSPYEQAVYNLAGHYLVEFAPDQSYLISALSWSAGLATATTAAAHAIQPGDKLNIVGVSPLGYSGDPRLGHVIAQVVPDSTHFSYGCSPNPGSATLLASAAAVERMFADARRSLKMTAFMPGVVTSANDLSTGAGLLNPEFMRNLSLENLQLLKSPYGRAYLAIAQKAGPNIWGLS